MALDTSANMRQGGRRFPLESWDPWMRLATWRGSAHPGPQSVSEYVMFALGRSQSMAMAIQTRAAYVDVSDHLPCNLM
eukprot:8214391-Heterocapsa_arctica.AAC.1